MAANDGRRSAVHRIAVSLATRIHATEAIFFDVSPDTEWIPQAIVHIRPDNSDEKVREKAVAAFRDLIAPCIKLHKDGAIEIDGPMPLDNKDSQFCIVRLLKNEKGQLRGTFAFIARCKDLPAARELLEIVREGID